MGVLEGMIPAHVSLHCICYNTLHKAVFGHSISAALNELFTAKLLTVEECTEVAEEGHMWGEHLALDLASKSVEKEASEVLEKHGCHLKDLKRRFQQLHLDRFMHMGVHTPSIYVPKLL